MKIQCDVCERAEATVLCCADEAALCWGCDDKVHAANKLAGKHQRVPLLSPSSQVPKCDICQEKSGYFFCLEDRALLCRQCDVSIHTSTPYASSHQRFLVTGVKVGLHQSQMGSSLAQDDSSSINPPPVPASPSAASLRKQRRDSSVYKAPIEFYSDRMAGFSAHWPLDEMMLTTTASSSSKKRQSNGFFLGFPGCDSSKVDSQVERSRLQ